MAIGGGLLLFISLFSFILQKPHSIFLITYVIVLGVLLYLIIKLALFLVKSTKKKNTVYLEKDQKGFLASNYSKEMIKKEGIASTDLKPSGYIKIDEKYFQAVSKSKYIEKGKNIVVIAGEGARLIVKEIGEY